MRRRSAARSLPGASPSRSYRAPRSPRGNVLVQSKYFSPGASQRRNKAVTFTAVPLFVRGRQEICPGGRFSFCFCRRGATDTWPNCTISRNNAGYRGGRLYVYPAICSRNIAVSPFLAFRSIRGRDAHPREGLRIVFRAAGTDLGSFFSPHAVLR